LDDTIVVNYIEVPVLARLGVMRCGKNAVSIHGGPTVAVELKKLIIGARYTVVFPR
jgi:hypothetical protein